MLILWVGVPLNKVAHLFFTTMCVPTIWYGKWYNGFVKISEERKGKISNEYSENYW
jgi:hypothetical protein